MARKPKQTPTARFDARYDAKRAVTNVLELADLVRLAAGAAYNVKVASKGRDQAIASKVSDILEAVVDAMFGDDAMLEDLHGEFLKRLAKRPFWSDWTRARYRLKKGAKANLRSDAIEIASALYMKPGPMNPRDPAVKMLAEVVDLLADKAAKRSVTAAQLCKAFQKGWGAAVEENALRLLGVALGDKKAARNAMEAAADQRAKRSAAKN